MSDHEHARIVADFTSDLVQALTIAGPPSLGKLRRKSEELADSGDDHGVKVETLAESTTSDILAGRRVRLPRWSWVRSFWCTLRALMAEDGMNPDRICSLEALRHRYEIADTALRRMDAAKRRGAARHPIEHESERGIGELGHRINTPMLMMGGVGEETQRDSPLQLIMQRVGTRWWDEFSDVVPSWCRPYLSLEPAARLIRSYETHYIPGLLQTRAYAETVIRSGHPGACEAEIQRRLRLRMLRQRIFAPPTAPMFWTIIDERVLRHPVGDEATMRTQIEHLLSAHAHTNITIQVMQLESGNHDAAGGPISLLRFEPRDCPDVVYIEHPDGGLYPSRVADVASYSQILSRLAIEALLPDASERRLHQILAEI